MRNFRIEFVHLDDQIAFDGFGRVEAFQDGVGSRIFDGGAAELNRLLEHADHKVAVEQIFARLGVHQRQIVVVSVGALVAFLADVHVGASGRNPRHKVVAVLRLIVRSVVDDARRIVATTHAANVCQKS